MEKRRIYDPPLTIRVVNKQVNYDFASNTLISGNSLTGAWRKNGYLAYDMNNEELGIVFEDDAKKNPYYRCADILFFKSYKENHIVGIWRVIRPTEHADYVNAKGYIDYDTLRHILTTKGSITFTTKPTHHSPNEPDFEE